MLVTENHRLYGLPPEICIIRTKKEVLEWALYIFDGEFFYPASSIGSWPQYCYSTIKAIALARECQKTNEWKDYPIAIYYGNDGFLYGASGILGENTHERREVIDDADIVQHLLANTQ